MKLTIAIKAYNEESNIAAAIVSALTAAKAYDGEVILADSASSDDTLRVASTFPVQILTLVNGSERSCGTGAQLAFQQAKGEFFYLLDGDMVLNPDFIPAGIAFLEAHPECAAVGGRVLERNVVGEEFQIRLATVTHDKNWLPGMVNRLDCGGLYRTSVLHDLGYFADRNLHAFEEFELGARLRSNGWQLARIDLHSVDHFGYTSGGYKLLWRRLKSGYSNAAGEVLRAAIGQKHFWRVLFELGHVRNGVAVLAWWVLLIGSLVKFSGSPFLTLGLLFVPFLFLAFRRKSWRLGLYSMVAWNVSALGLILGLFHKRISPQKPINYAVVNSLPTDQSQPVV